MEKISLKERRKRALLTDEFENTIDNILGLIMFDKLTCICKDVKNTDDGKEVIYQSQNDNCEIILKIKEKNGG